MKNRTAFFALRSPDTSVMVFDDGSAERQAQAGTARFGRVEGIEDVLQLIGCDSGAGVTDVQLHAFTIQADRADRNTARSALRPEASSPSYCP